LIIEYIEYLEFIKAHNTHAASDKNRDYDKQRIKKQNKQLNIQRYKRADMYK